MPNKNKPFKSTKRPVEINRKSSSQSTGWYRSVKDKISQLNNDITGLRDRLKSIKSNTNSQYQEFKGVPACYKRDFVFEPEDQTYPSDSGNPGVGFPAFLYSDLYGTAPNPTPFNYIVRDGVTHDIAVPIQSEGVFLAKFLKVTIFRRVFVPDFTDPADPNDRTRGGQDGGHPIQVKLVQSNVGPFSLAPGGLRFTPNLPWTTFGDGTAGGEAYNYFWNIVDKSSGRKYADDLLSSEFLLNQTMPATRFNTPDRYGVRHDGGFFEFDQPWMFERDSELQFQFRPVMPIIQVDPSSPFLPYGFDDREDGGNKRNGNITVRIEIHGAKFLTYQDSLKFGARFWRNS